MFRSQMLLKDIYGIDEFKSMREIMKRGCLIADEEEEDQQQNVEI